MCVCVSAQPDLYGYVQPSTQYVLEQTHSFSTKHSACPRTTYSLPQANTQFVPGRYTAHPRTTSSLTQPNAHRVCACRWLAVHRKKRKKATQAVHSLLPESAQGRACARSCTCMSPSCLPRTPEPLQRVPQRHDTAPLPPPEGTPEA